MDQEQNWAQYNYKASLVMHVCVPFGEKVPCGNVFICSCTKFNNTYQVQLEQFFRR